MVRDLETLSRLLCGFTDAFAASEDRMTDIDYERFIGIDTHVCNVLFRNLYWHTEEERRTVGEKGVRILKRLLGRPAYGVPPTLLSDEYLLRASEEHVAFRTTLEQAATTEEAFGLIVEKACEIADAYGVPHEETLEEVRRWFETEVDLDNLQEEIKRPN